MLTLFSPAKINLFLRIVGKRADGYHCLSSLFQTISLGDTLTIELSDTDKLTCTHSQIPVDSSNLISKAVEIFRRHTSIKQCFNIQLIKQIPIEAGLGGGSSNAATVLWACNQLTKCGASLQMLKEWGQEIGSDVPFFFSQGTAYCTGRGELVYQLPALHQRPLWIIKPKFGLSTKEVYQRLNFKESELEKRRQDDLDHFLFGNLPCFNDLEKPAFEMRPELSDLKASLLQKGFEVAVMSGSGSAFFCMGKGEMPEKLADAAIYPAAFLNRSHSDWYGSPF